MTMVLSSDAVSTPESLMFEFMASTYERKVAILNWLLGIHDAAWSVLADNVPTSDTLNNLQAHLINRPD